MSKHRTTFAIAGLTLCSALTAAPAAVAASAAQDATEASVVDRVNAIRAERGLPELRRSGALATAADRKAREVATTETLSHSSPDGTSMQSRLRRYVNASNVGETLGIVPRGGSQAARIVDTWMSSPGHRDALLSAAYRRVGVGRRGTRFAGGRAAVFALDLASAH